MPSSPSDPQPEPGDATPPEEEDWGDAVEESSAGDWGDTNLPVLRGPTEQSQVTVIESGGTVGDSQTDEVVRDDGNKSARGGVVVREISGNRPRRLRPEKPDIEKMPRKDAPMERAKHERFDVEDKEWSESTPIFRTKWIVGLSVAVPALIVFCLIQLPQLNPPENADLETDEFAPELPTLFQIKDEDIEDLLDRQEEAKALYEAYVSASSVEELLTLVRDPSEVEPLIRAAGHEAKASKDWKLKENALWSMHVQGTMPYACLRGELPDFEVFACYFVVQDERLVVDWEASQAYCSSSFEELARGQGDASEVRGVITPSNLYTDSFPESEYQCYRFESPNGYEMLWCYAKLDTAIAGSIARMFVGGEIANKAPGPVRITLGLARGKDGALPNQWLIQQLHHEQWISP